MPNLTPWNVHGMIYDANFPGVPGMGGRRWPAEFLRPTNRAFKRWRQPAWCARGAHSFYVPRTHGIPLLPDALLFVLPIRLLDTTIVALHGAYSHRLHRRPIMTRSGRTCLACRPASRHYCAHWLTTRPRVFSFSSLSSSAALPWLCPSSSTRPSTRTPRTQVRFNPHRQRRLPSSSLLTYSYTLASSARTRFAFFGTCHGGTFRSV